MRSCRGGKHASACTHWPVRTTGGSIERFTPSMEITMAAKKKTAKKAAKKAPAKKTAKKAPAKKTAKKTAKKAKK